MKLVWHHPEMRQKDWVRSLFGDGVTGEIMDPEFTCFEDDTIHVVSMTADFLSDLDPYFGQCRKRCNNIALYHAGTARFAGKNAPYRHFDNVVREMPGFALRCEGVTAAPLGHVTPLSTEPPAPASQRPLIWSFAGEISDGGIEMIKHFNAVPYGKVVGTNSALSLRTSEYHALLEGSIFTPCGTENVFTETSRVCEAIGAGSIPLLGDPRMAGDLAALFGKHPIPTFSDWRDAADFAHQMMDREASVDALQTRVTGWWRDYKRELVVKIAAMLAKSHRDALGAFTPSPAKTFGRGRDSLRLSELLRHQSSHTLGQTPASSGAPPPRAASPWG